MSYGRGDQRSAISEADSALSDFSLVPSILRTWGAAVLRPYEQETAHLSTRRTARNLVFVEVTVALPVGVES
jgi:hypothetical protein